MRLKLRKYRPEILSDAALCTGSPVSVNTGNPPAETLGIKGGRT
jgi:hypothetical protein